MDTNVTGAGAPGERHLGSRTARSLVTRRHAIATSVWSVGLLAACVVRPSAAAKPPTPVVATLTSVPPTPGVVTAPIGMFINAGTRLRPISSLIFGMAGASMALHQQTRHTLERWGGNPTTRYNWRLGNAYNAARDYQFRNGNYGATAPSDRVPSGVADKAMETTRTMGVKFLLTVPAMGWVAKDDNPASRSLDVPRVGGDQLPGRGPDGPIAGYDPAANRGRTSVRSVARAAGAPGPPAVAQDDWIRHLTRKFGQTAHGGVGFYAIDNEPDLWGEIQTDVHPARMGYDDMLAMFLDYATAIKAADPTALVTGPVVSGWTSLFYSALDRSTDNFHAARDRARHGGTAFLPWWLARIKAHDEKAGKRTLDVVDVHYYPQGGEYQPGGTDPATNARRLRSTRSLWDPTYIDESWIARTQDEHGHKGIVELIPRLRTWIAANYPGTKIGITEWNFGADDTPNGALAIIDVLGVFAREGVFLGAYWRAPKADSPGALAFQAFRNYDGHGASIGDTALSADVTDRDKLSCYATLDSSSGDLVAVVTNKTLTEAVTASLRVASFTSDAVISGYRYLGSGPVALTPIPDQRLADSAVALEIPPTSITVLRFKKA